MFFNCKTFFFIVLQDIGGAHYTFIAIEVGGNVSCISAVPSNAKKKLPVPEPEALPG